MNPRLIVLAVLLFMSCSCSLPGRGAPNSSSEQTPGPAVGANAAAYEVKVTKDGAVLAAYSDKGPRAFAMFDGKMLLISLASPDTKHVLTIEVQGTKAGVYPLAKQYETAKSGEARLNFITEGPPALIPAKGELKMDEFSGTTCSGSFNGTGTDIKGAKFSIEGSFSKLVVKQAE